MNLPNAKLIVEVVLVSFLAGGVALASPFVGQKKGYIQNDNGGKCWYTQSVKENNTYFHSLKGTNGILVFDNPGCMSDSGMGLDINKMLINNIVSRWYSHSDADFKNRVSEMYNGSPMQKKGKCIQSKKYPSIGITIDYFIEGKSIAGVVHGPSIQGCTN